MAKLLHPICAARSLLPVAALLVFAQCGANGNTVDARSDAAPNDAAVGDARQGALGPTFWAGAYLNGGGFDSDGIAAAVQADIGHSIPVLQTYRSTAAAGIAKIATDLNALYALGAIPHLYIEPAKDLSAGWPANYTRTQYENASVDPEIAADLGKVATAVVDALVINAQRQLLFSFGAEMNGGWTPWGCLTPSTFVALHSKMHMVLSVEMQRRGVAAQRVRWVYAPDSRGSTKRQDGRGNRNVDAFAAPAQHSMRRRGKGLAGAHDVAQIRQFERRTWVRVHVVVFAQLTILEPIASVELGHVDGGGGFGASCRERFDIRR